MLECDKMYHLYYLKEFWLHIIANSFIDIEEKIQSYIILFVLKVAETHPNISQLNLKINENKS